MNIVTETGSIFMPVSKRVEALHELQVQRDREEDPHQDQVLGEEHDRPARSVAMANSAKWTSGSGSCVHDGAATAEDGQ